MLPTKLIFLDTETTGLSVYRDRIIEIGFLVVENGKIIKKFQTVLNPQKYLSPFITQITGITERELENAPLFEDIAGKLLEEFEDSVLVAHNARFDYGFLKNEFRRIEKKFTMKHLCTAKLSRRLFPRDRHHNLDAIIEKFHIHCKNRHRAYDDAKVLFDFYKKLQKIIPQDTFDAAIHSELRHPSRPLHIAEKVLGNLPEYAGVYIFYGDNNTPIYIGKSINIKERVLSHFAQDHTHPSEMQLSQQVKHIETHVTAGELGALLLEAKLIKEMQPVYNRRLRQARRLVLVKSSVSKAGYEIIHLEDAVTINPDDTKSIRGVHKSKRSAKEYLIALAKEYMLCEKLLGLEKIRSTGLEEKSACFGYRLGNCKGACIGKENPLAYNTRCILAFSKDTIKPWIADGPVFIYEQNPENHKTDVFIVDKWCLLGRKSIDADAEKLSQEEYRFDVDTYKILVRYLKNQKNLKNIHIPTDAEKMFLKDNTYSAL